MKARLFVAILVLALVGLWAILPTLVPVENLLKLTTTYVGEGPTGMPQYRCELHNRGLWPIFISRGHWYAGPGQDARNELGVFKPSEEFTLAPFESYTFEFAVITLGCTPPCCPPTLCVTFSGQVTVLYTSQQITLTG